MRPGPRRALRPGAAGWRHALAAVLLAGAVAVSGCSPAGQSSGSGHSPSPAGSSSSAGKVSAGTQLGSLLTGAQLPAGWSQDTGAGDPETDSGSSLDQIAGPPSGQDTSCESLDSATSALLFVDWWSVSNATLILQGTPQNGSLLTPQLTLTIGGYKPADYASRTLSTATSLASGCGSFTSSLGNSVTVTSSTSTVPQIGSASVYLASTTQMSSGPDLTQVLLAQVGNYVIGVDTSSALDGTVSEATVDQFGQLLARLVQAR
jgi:hypothetical protein